MAESKVKKENYITIQGFMITDLKLKGNELLIYAVIYGFSQGENQVFSGNLQYLADWTNSTKRGVIKGIQALVEKGYLTKTEVVEKKQKTCTYKAINPVNKVQYPSEQSSPPPVNKVQYPSEQSSPPPVNKVQYPSEQSSPPQTIEENIIDKIIDNIEKRKKEMSKEKKEAEQVGTPTKHFIKPTLEEVENYCQERNNNVNAQRFIDFYQSKGWKIGKEPMKDWKACVRTWEQREEKEQQTEKNKTWQNMSPLEKQREMDTIWGDT